MTLLDSIMVIFYIDWDNDKVYPFVSWQRTYDNFLFSLMYFSSPEQDSSLYSGDGGLFLISYNY